MICSSRYKECINIRRYIEPVFVQTGRVAEWNHYLAIRKIRLLLVSLDHTSAWCCRNILIEKGLLQLIFHIVTKTDWMDGQISGTYWNRTIHTDGFIHCSTREQVIHTANNIFRGRTDLLLLCIDPGRVISEIVYEDLYNTEKLFPHIYGELNLDAVTAVLELVPEMEWTFSLPRDVP